MGKEGWTGWTTTCRTSILKSDDGGAPQLCVRETASAQRRIVLSVRLFAGMPCRRKSKKDLSISVVPNPPLPKEKKDTSSVEEKLVTYMIRVKDSYIADELFERIQKHMPSSD